MDLISKTDALERIFNQCEEIEAHLPADAPDKTGYKMFPDYMTVWKYLRQLPSAERRGRWILRYGDGHIEMSIVGGECSLCGFVAPATRYCPYCGARMDGEEE